MTAREPRPMQTPPPARLTAPRTETVPVVERVLTALGADPDFAEAVLGDLAEEHAQRAARDGVRAARWWYIREAARSTPHLVRSALRHAATHRRARLATCVGGVVLTLAVLFVALSMRVGPPARIVAGRSDTVVVNNVYAVRLPVQVLDARGRAIDSARVRYESISGAAIQLSDSGVVTCAQSGDATVRAAIGTVATSMVLHCRPVDKLRLAQMELVAGDTAQHIQFSAVGTDGRRVELLAGSARILDSTVASLEGTRVRPRAPGETVLEVRVGDRAQAVPVYVYERASTPAAIRPGQNLAVPVRLASGDLRIWSLPAGAYILSIWPDTSALRFAVLKGSCERLAWQRSYYCGAGGATTVIVYNPRPASGATPELSAELALRRLPPEWSGPPRPLY